MKLEIISVVNSYYKIDSLLIAALQVFIKNNKEMKCYSSFFSSMFSVKLLLLLESILL